MYLCIDLYSIYRYIYDTVPTCIIGGVVKEVMMMILQFFIIMIEIISTVSNYYMHVLHLINLLPFMTYCERDRCSECMYRYMYMYLLT